jgi:hypothetical protein
MILLANLRLDPHTQELHLTIPWTLGRSWHEVYFICTTDNELARNRLAKRVETLRDGRIVLQDFDKQEFTVPAEVMEGAEIALKLRGSSSSYIYRLPASLREAYEDNPELKQVLVNVLYRGDPGLGYGEYVLCDREPENPADYYEYSHDYRVIETNAHSREIATGDVLEGLGDYYFTPELRRPFTWWLPNHTFSLSEKATLYVGGVVENEHQERLYRAYLAGAAQR